MRAGSMRHRVTIQRSALQTADAYGAQVEAWADVKTVWAEVRPLTGSEAWKTKQVQPEATSQVTMRYTSDLTSADRLKFGTRYLYPSSVTYDVRSRETRLLCMEKI